MAAIEQRVENANGTDLFSVPVAAGNSTMQAIELLDEAHNIYDYLEPQSAARRTFLEERIERDRTELEEIKGETKQNRATSERLGSYRAEYLREMLQDPASQFHPVFRTILLNAERRGTLENRQTFNESRRLGEGLVGLTHFSEHSSEPLPLVMVKNIPTQDNPTPNLQLDYGYAYPGAKVELFEEGDAISWRNLSYEVGTQPWVSLPTIEDPPMHAVMQSSNNSHFVGDNSRVVKVDNGGYMLEDTLSLEDAIPTIGRIKLPLPIGDLYTHKDRRPYVIHDNLDGGLEKIELPGNYQGITRDRLLVVGANAIKHVFSILPAHIENILGEEKGRVSKAMTITVAHEELGLEL
jgi:hypothetical protein